MLQTTRTATWNGQAGNAQVFIGNSRFIGEVGRDAGAGDVVADGNRMLCDRGSGSLESVSRMTPYYEHAGITIYHGDCNVILPEMPRHDLLLTDPPYGIAFVHSGKGGCLAKSTIFGGVKIYGDDQDFDPLPFLLLSESVVLWGANHYANRLPNYPCWLVWDKREGMCTNDQADCEMAWTNKDSPARLIRHFWNGMLKQSEKGVPRSHPTQKPIALMKWCLSLFPDAKTVLDPFAGSGTTGIACKAMGLQCTMIEIEEKYCEIAAKRLSQEVLDFSGVPV